MIVTDGVFSADADDTAVFHPALHLAQTDYLSVQQKMRHCGLRWLLRHGHLDSAAVHTLHAPDRAGRWSVDASVTIPTWDRHGLERLVRYCARPALSLERLGRVSDEMLVYSLKKPTVDGRTEIYLTPLELNSFPIPPEPPTILPARSPPQGEFVFDQDGGRDDWPEMDQSVGTTGDSWE